MACGAATLLCAVAFAADAPPDFNRDVAPILRKYCQGCHNADETNADLRLDVYDEILKGGEHGAALVPGDAKVSRIIRLTTGQAEPAMPPKDEKQPSPDEIAVLAAWIDAGAKGPSGDAPARTLLLTPALAPAK
ncbi:MAG: hypothetical protein KDA41_05810, partial [Planctomycetales bacterium]|nr:hypothetical protein [Planctomycetales bacterium]